ncbi:hypothetical protein M422DRAFT_246279 [Sphaerobolus stellatus SS14]|nr:hypothetical protein M422DRAFT_246279 [Sphaerobolus stellatus SS14]
MAKSPLSSWLSLSPAYDTLMGLSEREINELIARNGVAELPNPPLPSADGGLKLVNDPAHLFITLETAQKVTYQASTSRVIVARQGNASSA